MRKTDGASKARGPLGEIRKEVAGSGTPAVIERQGEPTAAVDPMALGEQWAQQRDAFFDRLEDLALTANLSPSEADNLAAEAVRAVRGTVRT